MKKIIDTAAKVVSFAMVIFALFVDIWPKIYLTFFGKALFYCLPAVILFINMIFQIKKSSDGQTRERHRRQGLTGIFVIYCLTLFSLLFLRYGAFHSILNFNPGAAFTRRHFEISANLIPFKTIKLFFMNIDSGSFVINIIGNLVVFMPMGFFAHFLFEKKIKNAGILALIMILTVCAVEFLQFVLYVGSADIDDVILNTLGAEAAYLIFMLKPLKSAVNKLFGVIENENEKKEKP